MLSFAESTYNDNSRLSTPRHAGWLADLTQERVKLFPSGPPLSLPFQKGQVCNPTVPTVGVPAPPLPAPSPLSLAGISA